VKGHAGGLKKVLIDAASWRRFAGWQVGKFARFAELQIGSLRGDGKASELTSFGGGVGLIEARLDLPLSCAIK
jgi:hypothetical protein